MPDDFLVDPSVLESDSPIWTGWSEQATTLAKAVPTIGGGLAESDFSKIPGAGDAMEAYRSTSSDLVDQLEKGAKSLAGAAEKLTTVSSLYRSAEEQNLSQLKQFEI